MSRIVTIILFLGAFLLRCDCRGQRAQIIPEIGEKMPPFLLQDVKYLDGRLVDNDTFRGKWLILYFWSLGCKGSIQGLTKLNDIQEEFAQYIQVIAIGRNYGKINDGIDIVFERLRRNRGYQIPVVFDSTLRQQWNIETVPHIYLIDPEGILRYVTDGSDMTIQKIKYLLKGESVSFESKARDQHWRNTGGRYILNKNLTPDRVRYVSVITEWDGERPEFGFAFDRYVSLPEGYHEQGWTMTRASLKVLYAYAYLGRAYWLPRDTSYYAKFWSQPKLEVGDRAPFLANYNCYLKLPKGEVSVENMKKALQDALNLAFGYKAMLEVHDAPVWKLVAMPGAMEKLRSKGGRMAYEGNNAVVGVKVRNYPIEDFLYLVTSSLSNSEGLVFIDESNISFGVDVNIQTDMTDLSCIKESLREYGLDLVKDTKPMQVLVIRE